MKLTNQMIVLTIFICCTLTTATLRDFGKQITKFSWDFHLASTEDGNVFSSPLSIYTSLYTAYVGTAGTTKEQIIRSVVPDERSIEDGFLYLTHVIINSDSNEYELDIVNRAYISNKLKVKDSYNDALWKTFSSTAKRVDFSNNERVCDLINRDVAEHTNYKIPNFIQADSIDRERTLMMITSAIYFKGEWGQKFLREDTKPGDFHTKGDKVEAEMMHVTGEFLHEDLYDAGAQVLHLPYKGGKTKMVILLPYETDGLEKMQKDLKENYDLEDILEGDYLTEIEIKVSLPKFKMQKRLDVKKILYRMGVTDLFDKYKADMSEMSSEPAFVSEFFHKAFIEVNEEGTEAAAATGDDHVAVKCGPQEFIADHPFLFYIYYEDRSFSSILFNGKLENPIIEI